MPYASYWKKLILILGLALSLVLAGLFLGWWLRGPTKGSEQLEQMLKEMDARPASAEDWSNLNVVKSSIEIEGKDYPMVTAKNIRPLLECDQLTSAHHLKIKNVRNNSELKSILWSHKSGKILEFDWLNNTVKPLAINLDDTTFILGPESVPANSKYNHAYSIGTPGSKKGINTLSITTPAGTSKLPWERKSFIGEAYYFKGYKFAFCLERGIDSGKFESVTIIDLENQSVAGFATLPTQVGRYAPLMLLDPNTDLFLCFDLDISWIVCIDIRKGIDQNKKPWPPSWPCPALGPWYGNDDVQRGKVSQLAEGSEAPPKPENYP